MPNEHDKDMILALKLSVEWHNFRLFCKERTSCKECPYVKDHICSITSTEKILTKVAKAARTFLEKEGIQV